MLHYYKSLSHWFYSNCHQSYGLHQQPQIIFVIYSFFPPSNTVLDFLKKLFFLIGLVGVLPNHWGFVFIFYISNYFGHSSLFCLWEFILATYIPECSENDGIQFFVWFFLYSLEWREQNLCLLGGKWVWVGVSRTTAQISCSLLWVPYCFLPWSFCCADAVISPPQINAPSPLNVTCWGGGS